MVNGVQHPNNCELKQHAMTTQTKGYNADKRFWYKKDISDARFFWDYEKNKSR